MSNLKDFIKEARAEHRDNTYTALYNSDKDQMKVLGGYPCHGNLGFNIRGYNQVFVHIRKHRDVNKDSALDFLDFWLNRSPAQQIFITKDAKEAYEDCVVVDLTQPSNMVGYGLIGLRACYENYNSSIRERLDSFDKLKQLGFSEWESFLFAFMVVQERKNEWLFRTIASDHCVVPGNLYSGWLKAALKGQFVNVSKHAANGVNTITDGGVIGIFKPNDPDKSVHNFITNIKPLSGKNAKNLNPFTAHRSAGEGYVYRGDEELKQFINEVKELVA